MAKEPRLGRVKTRLGRDIGIVPATWWFRHQSKTLINRLQDPRWEIVLSVSPDVAAVNSNFWPRNVKRIGQGHGDIGQKMTRIFRDMPKGPVLVIGADIPGVRKKHIAHAFGQLGSHDAVFGPATDGGYWLIGLKRMRKTPPRLFHNVRWSSERALSDSIAGLPFHRIAQIQTLTDVDQASDLQTDFTKTLFTDRVKSTI